MIQLMHKSSTWSFQVSRTIMNKHKHHVFNADEGMSIGFIHCDYYFLICVKLSFWFIKWVRRSSCHLYRKESVMFFDDSNQKEGPQLNDDADAQLNQIGWTAREKRERQSEKNAIKIMDFYALATQTNRRKKKSQPIPNSMWLWKYMNHKTTYEKWHFYSNFLILEIVQSIYWCLRRQGWKICSCFIRKWFIFQRIQMHRIWERMQCSRNVRISKLCMESA